MRHPFVMGNWKLNGNTHMVNQLIAGLRDALSSVDGCKVAIAPPVMYLDQAKRALIGSRISLGAQNVDINLSGAFTGEVSVNMLRDVGAQYVIIGHSERRFYHKESNKAIAKKFALIKEEGLIPVLCLGETAVENEAGKTEEVCRNQINAILKTLGVQSIRGAVIAYEPVWAIGTGNSATPEQAQGVHKYIRDYIAKHDTAVAAEVIIQYGGSVNNSNAKELFAQPDIDGALVGGASLKLNIFAEIVKTASTTKAQLNSTVNTDL